MQISVGIGITASCADCGLECEVPARAEQLLREGPTDRGGASATVVTERACQACGSRRITVACDVDLTG